MTQPDLFTRRVRKPPAAAEMAIQAGIVDLLRRCKLESWAFIHPASGEQRTAATAAKLYRMGVEPGWPDLILIGPTPPKVFFMEIKSKRGTLSAAQLAFRARCEELHLPHEVVRTIDEGVAVLKAWGALRTRVEAAA